MDKSNFIEVCLHEIDAIRVIESVATYEITALFCIECGKQLSEPKTEC